MERRGGKDDENKLGGFAKYSTLAFQMLATIGVLSFVGYKIDKSGEGDQMIYTAVFGLLGVILSLYQIIRALKKP